MSATVGRNEIKWILFFQWKSLTQLYVIIYYYVLLEHDFMEKTSLLFVCWAFELQRSWKVVLTAGWCLSSVCLGHKHRLQLALKGSHTSFHPCLLGRWRGIPASRPWETMCLHLQLISSMFFRMLLMIFSVGGTFISYLQPCGSLSLLMYTTVGSNAMKALQAVRELFQWAHLNA